MKSAVIVVGPHFSGKSKTIKIYFKPLIGLSGNQRAFHINDHAGFVLSQSFEEKRLGQVISQSIEEKGLTNVEAFLSRYLSCRWLVLAARPFSEPGSHLKEIQQILENNDFNVHIVEVVADQSESFYEQRGKTIKDFLLAGVKPANLSPR